MAPARLTRMDKVFSIAGLALLVFLVLPLVATIFASSPDEFVRGVADESVLSALLLTLAAALVATTIAIACGIPLAYVLARRTFVGQSLVQGLVDLPLVIPHTAAGVAVLMVFGRRGLLGGPLASLGLFFTENFAGIVIAMLFVSVPLLVDSARETFALVDARLEGVARTLGVRPWTAFRRVTLPLAWRGIVAGAVLMWARGISEFGAVVMVAYNPKTIAVLVYERFAGFGLSATLPITILLLVLALVVISAVRAILAPRRPWQRSTRGEPR